MKTRNITLAAGIIIALAAGAAGAYAYYSAKTDTVTNTYNIVAGGGASGETVGKVEESFDPETAKNLEPRATFTKDVKVSSNLDYSSHVYLLVTVPMMNSRLKDETDKKLRDSVSPNFDTSSWTLVKSSTGTASAPSKYLYRYSTVLPAKGKTKSLFTKVTVPDYVEADGVMGSIDITGYMISAVNVATADADKDAGSKFFP